MENTSEFKLKVLRTDNGSEFCNEEFNQYYKVHGNKRYKTVPNTPQ